MPKVWQKYIKSGSLSGLWQICESEEELRSRLVHFPEERFRHRDRTRQWLASRVLLQDILAEMGYESGYGLKKLPDGRPELSIAGLHVSISHAGDYAAVAVSREKIGIDIERIGSRIQKVAHKFMNDGDMKRLNGQEDLVWMHTVWSAKEALFKYFPGGSIDFREHLHIDHVEEDGLQCRVIREGKEFLARVPYLYFDDYILAWAWERPQSE